jgi:hypothetical protein
VDNESLDDMLQDKRERQYWLKPVSRPGVPLGRDPETFPESEVETHFVDRVDNIAEGDVLIVYRTGVAKLMFVAVRLPHSQWTTPPANRSEENKRRYPYFFKAKNLTPEYGVCWPGFNHKPFTLANQLNPLHPEDLARLGRIQHHSDRAPIPRWFAEYLIQRTRDSVRRP